MIDLSRPVKVYRNLHNGLYSVKQGRYVVAHVDSITLVNADFIVNESGRQRVIRDKKKNVHAFISGMVVAVNTVKSCAGMIDVIYNPYLYNNFVYGITKHKASCLDEQKVYISTAQGVFIDFL